MGILRSLSSLLGNKDTQTKTPTTAAKQSDKRKKIVIVEDDTDLRDFYREYLTSEGYSVTTADNGQTGLETIKAEDPNLVLLDIMLPVMDGKAVLHTMRGIPEFKYTPVIILTNAGDADTMQQTKVFDNADDFLVKANITPDELLRKIKALIV